MFNLIHKLIVALLGKSKNINTMANNEQYPRFIPDKQLEMMFLKVNLRPILRIIFVSTFVLMILHPLENGGRCLE